MNARKTTKTNKQPTQGTKQDEIDVLVISPSRRDARSIHLLTPTLLTFPIESNDIRTPSYLLCTTRTTKRKQALTYRKCTRKDPHHHAAIDTIAVQSTKYTASFQYRPHFNSSHLFQQVSPCVYPCITPRCPSLSPSFRTT